MRPVRDCKPVLLATALEDERAGLVGEVGRDLRLLGDEERALPYQRYPSVPGLLPWATYGDVDVLSWYTAGEPDLWHVIYDDREEGFTEVPGLGFAGFLIAGLQGAVPLPERIFDKQVMAHLKVYKPF